MKVTVTNGQPSAPVTVADGFDFPDQRHGVRAGHRRRARTRRGPSWRRLSGPAENPAPDKGPPTNAPATAGFG